MSPSDISSAISFAIRSAWFRATSTPMSRVNNQAFLGLLTRAMTRGTLNSNSRQRGDHQVLVVVTGDCRYDLNFPDAGLLQAER